MRGILFSSFYKKNIYREIRNGINYDVFIEKIGYLSFLDKIINMRQARGVIVSDLFETLQAVCALCPICAQVSEFVP